MIFKLMFVVTFVWLLLRLVQHERLSLDLASLTLVMILCVLALSFSPFLVERIAVALEFSNPAMSVIALALVGLVVLCLILAVSVSDLRRRQAIFVRQLARLQSRLSHDEHPAIAQSDDARSTVVHGEAARSDGLS